MLHIGSHIDCVVLMDDKQQSTVNEETNFGVLISRDLKPNHYCSEVIKTANKQFCFIGRTFDNDFFKSYIKTIIHEYEPISMTAYSFGSHIIK